jgi:hypothetical protein
VRNDCALALLLLGDVQRLTASPVEITRSGQLLLRIDPGRGFCSMDVLVYACLGWP